MPPKKKSGKKGDDDWDEESNQTATSNVTSSTIDSQKSNKKGGKKGRRGDDSEEDIPVKKAEPTPKKPVYDDLDQGPDYSKELDAEDGGLLGLVKKSAQARARRDTKKKKGKKDDSDDEEDTKKDAFGFGALANEEDDVEEVVGIAKKGKGKQKAKKPVSFADLGQDNEDPEDEELVSSKSNSIEKESPGPAPLDNKKGKKGKKGKSNEEDEEDLQAILKDIADGKPVTTEPTPVPVDNKKGKGNKKGKKGQQEDEEDLDAILKDIADGKPVEASAPNSTAQNTGAKGKKGKKGKNVQEEEENIEEILKDIAENKPVAPQPPKAAVAGKKGKKGKQDEDEDLDALLEQMKATNISAPPVEVKDVKDIKKQAEPVKPAETKPEPPKKAEDSKEDPQEEDEDDDDEGEDGTNKSSKDKKKKKKKKKTAEEKEKEKKGDKKISGALKGLKEALAAQKAAEEAAKRAEEEARRKEEEERLKAEEEERIAREKKEAKKAAEKAKKEELRRQGLLLSESEKKKRQMDQLKLQQLLAQGVKVAALQEEGAAAKPKKVVYGKKKKPQPGKKEGDQIAQEPTKSKEEDDDKSGEPEPLGEEAPVDVSADQAVPSTWEEVEHEEPLDDWEKLESADIVPGKKSASEPKPVTKVVPVEAKPAAPAPSKAAAPKVEEKKTEKGATKPIEQSSKSASTEKEDKKGKSTPVTAAKTASTVSSKSKKEEQVKEDEEDEDEDDDEDDDDDDDDDDEDDDDDDDDESESENEDEKRKAEAKARRLERKKQAMANRNKDDLRSPICVILGHVDTGKTKLLDKIRQTNVQEGEAGGITQQIGATYFPVDAIKQKTKVLNKDGTFEYKVPGLLIIDTPGHESFTNLRSRGSSLCNIAILVVDIMHGLEPQTIESIGLLRQRKTPFIVALNRIDRLYGWKSIPDNSSQDSLSKQNVSAAREFEDRLAQTKAAFAEQGLNAELYYRNKDVRKVVSLVPTSAITGEGIPDLLMFLLDLTQKMMSDQLMYVSELECTVLEVKVIDGHGTTIDVILSNGVLNEGDKVVVCGLNGPIVTNIRALLTPQPMRELRVKGSYVHHKSIKAAMGIKIAANGLESAIAGSRLMVVGPDDDEDEIKEEVMGDLADLLGSIDLTGRGVHVQASTLGSLEALLSFLKSSKIPVASISIGPVHKKDVIKASVMLEHAKEYATMLCFDVKVEKEAQDMADELGVKVFKAEIIYHLFDAFTAYMKELEEQRKRDNLPQAIFPCILKIVPGCIFNKKDPIILGVEVVEGILKVGTPICVPSRDKIGLGKVAGIEMNHKPVEKASRGDSVAVRIEPASYEASRAFGRHFNEKDELVSKITRSSIDTLKESFRNDLSREDWQLVVKLKKIFDIQ